MNRSNFLLALSMLIVILSIVIFPITRNYSFKSIIDTRFGSFEFEGKPILPE
jgi:hypothetical protein